MTKYKSLIFVITFILLVIIVFAFYFFWSNRVAKRNDIIPSGLKPVPTSVTPTVEAFKQLSISFPYDSSSNTGYVGFLNQNQSGFFAKLVELSERKVSVSIDGKLLEFDLDDNVIFTKEQKNENGEKIFPIANDRKNFSGVDKVYLTLENKMGRIFVSQVMEISRIKQ